MRPRHLIAALACCSVLSTGVGFAAAELSRPDGASARAADPVVSQLQALNKQAKTLTRSLETVNKGIGWNSFTPDMVGLLHDIERHTAGACDALDGSGCTTIYSSDFKSR